MTALVSSHGCNLEFMVPPPSDALVDLIEAVRSRLGEDASLLQELFCAVADDVRGAVECAVCGPSLDYSQQTHVYYSVCDRICQHLSVEPV